jgi:hypothetical protein
MEKMKARMGKTNKVKLLGRRRKGRRRKVVAVRSRATPPP